MSLEQLTLQLILHGADPFEHPGEIECTDGEPRRELLITSAAHQIVNSNESRSHFVVMSVQ